MSPIPLRAEAARAAAGPAQPHEALRPLAGRSAIVTGSTSGIGLGIARALALGGADVMLNGLGEPAAIEATRAGLAAASVHYGKLALAPWAIGI